MLIRQLEYFVAVARERHFGRAAAACYVSQPALSDALRKLEGELDVPLIKRGHSFEGLTPEGERLVIWARRVLADYDSMLAEARSLRAGLTGHLRIGAVPSASTTVADLVGRFCAACPLATVTLVTKLPEDDIVRRIREFELDAALSYPPRDAPDIVGVELYRERSVLIGNAELLDGAPEAMSWVQAAGYPFAALTESMRGRALMDRTFAEVGASPTIGVQTDSIASLYGLVEDGAYVAVVPGGWSRESPPAERIRTIALVDPVVEFPVHLVRAKADPVRPLLRALEDVART